MSWRGALLASWLVVAGCLPEAGPGLGQRRVAGRGLANLAAAPVRPGEPPTLFFSRKGAWTAAENPASSDRKIRDLYLSRPGRPDELLLPDYSWQDTLRFDARGRLYTYKAGVLIIDLDSGQRTQLGSPLTIDLISPGGTQHVYTTEAGTTIVRRTADDSVRELPDRLHELHFVDEVLYGVDARWLWRVRPDGSPAEQLAQNLNGYTLVRIPGGPPAIVLLASVGMCSIAEARLFHPDSPGTAPEPLGTVDTMIGSGVSVQGQQIVLREPATTYMEAAFRVVTLEPRTVRRFVVPTMPPAQRVPTAGRPSVSCPPQVPNLVSVRIRPGGEIWALGPRTLTIIQPDGRMETVTGPFTSFEPFQRLSGDWAPFRHSPLDPSHFHPPFSSDGRFWAYRDLQGRIRVAKASAPAGPNLIQLPTSIELRGVAELPGAGGKMIWTSPGGNETDVHIYDQGLTDRRRTIQDVRRMLIGDQRLVTRARGLVTDQYAPAMLELIDLTSGDVQPIAFNVTELVSLPACPTCDPTEPGAGVAYVASARVPWKYDGIWTATLP